MRDYERKLCIGLVLIALAFLPSLGFALYLLRDVTLAQETLGNRYARAMILAQSLRTQKLVQDAVMPAYVLSGDEGLLRAFEKATAGFGSTLSEIETLPLDPRRKALLVRIAELHGKLREAEAPGIAMRREGRDAAEVDAFFRSGAVAVNAEIASDLDRLANGLQADYEARRAYDGDAFRLAYRVLAAACAASVLSCGAALVLLLRLVAHKRAHDALRDDLAARDAEISSARKRSVDTVAHDLKNPLAAISMAAERIRRRGALAGSPSDARMVEVIAASAASMDLLIRNLLDHAKIEAGGLRLDLSPTDLGEVAARLGPRLSFLAGESGIELENRVPASLPPVEADPVRIEQVLCNLMANALKFTPPGGRVALDHAVDDGSLTLTVSDTGPGMTPEQADRAFDPNWQAARASPKGNGLGLAISKAIVDAHGGTIAVRTAPGAGAAFDVSLPLARPALAPADGGAPAPERAA